MFKTFRKHHNPQTLLEAHAKMFTPVIPWVHRDLTKVSWNLGKWRLMESPIMFLVRHRCLFDEKGKPFEIGKTCHCNEYSGFYADKEYENEDEALEAAKKEFENSSLIPDTNSVYLNTNQRIVRNRLDRKALRKVLGKQLGAKIEGDFIEHFISYLYNALHKWRFGLFMALVFHCFPYGKQFAYDILDKMNRSMGGNGEFQPEKIDIGDPDQIYMFLYVFYGSVRLNGTFPELFNDLHKKLNVEETSHPIFEFGRKVINTYGDYSRFKERIARHKAYENVLFVELLKLARNNGVLSTSYFGWVKAFDRTLWYALNQTGRAVASAEAAGVEAHWVCEEVINKAIPFPCVEPAIDGFESLMIKEGWLPEPKTQTE